MGNPNENLLEVNRFARRLRHLRVFSRKDLLKIHLTDIWQAALSPLKLLKSTTAYSRFSAVTLDASDRLAQFLPSSPRRRLFLQSVALATMILLGSSVTPGAELSTINVSYSSDYAGDYRISSDILVADESGYLIKINPQTGDSNRKGLTDYAVHTVSSGETLSLIAEDYGVKTSTIMWENGLSNANSLRIGQKLLVPPVDGVSYKVEAGDNLEKIAKKYSIGVDDIIAQNGLESEVLTKGQAIFLPGAQPIAAPAPMIAGRSTAVRSARTAVNATPSSASPAAGKPFIFPTSGKISQGFRAGHYALDIADRSKPAIWAAAGGTVTKVSTGTWGGGYGNHVIVDHGDGLQTLYAHMDSVNVSDGQSVAQGEVLGIMGNTGRVYGATGIHLHWEVIDNGVKVYPPNYY